MLTPLVRAAVGPAVALLLTACGAGSEAQPAPASPDAPRSPAPAVGQRLDEVVRAELGGVPLRLEVADDPAERATGLMGRTEVPDGTGMVFLWDEPVQTSFWMFQVPVPLTAVFVRDGVVVHVAQMAPCAETDSSRCPTYGPDEPVDAVVETAPETLPDVRVGDELTLER